MSSGAYAYVGTVACEEDLHPTTKAARLIDERLSHASDEYTIEDRDRINY